MIIKLSKAEKKVLQVLDPEQTGTRAWMTARDIAAGVFSRKGIEQEHIRTVRNAFRRIVREGMVEMSAEERGKYRISLKGRKVLSGGETEVDGAFSRGEATDAAKAAAAERMKRFDVKPTKGEGAAKAKPKKAADKAEKAAPKAKAKKVAKKAPAKKKKVAKKAAPKRKAKAEAAPAAETKAAKGSELNSFGRPKRQKKGASMLDKALNEVKDDVEKTKAPKKAAKAAKKAKAPKAAAAEASTDSSDKNGESKTKRKFTRREPVTYADGAQN